MFVKKFAERALSSKKPGGNTDGLKSSDLEPRLVFHYGIPLGSSIFAYDPIQKILAVSTNDGRIKLFGKDNTQALIQSEEAVSSKFLQFIQNRGILVNVTFKNHIEVWDIDKKQLSDVHVSIEEITSFTVLQHSLFLYIGDSVGNVSVLKLDEESLHVVQMKYTIPFSASHGNPIESSGDTAVLHILPQPTAESKRILIIFRDGLITLWGIRESEPIFATGGNVLQSIYQETKKVTSACWTCPFGSKVVVGYSNGDLLIWSIPSPLTIKSESATEFGTQSAPICKLNLGYKSDKIPISLLKWAYADGKASRLYVMGASDLVSANLCQVILLNEQTESRTVKLAHPLSEPCIDMGIISSFSEQNKHKQLFFLLLGKSGRFYAYDDCLMEKYLLQCQSRSPPSLPKEIMVKMPLVDSSITAAKLITDNPNLLGRADEDYILLAKDSASLLYCESNSKEGTRFSGFSKVKNLYITGHSDGAINFWDVSCPFLIPILSLKQQSEDDYSLSGIAITALHFEGNSQLLVSGDESGMVRIFKFKPEPYAMENSFIPFQGSLKRGNSHIIHSIKLLKVNGSVLSLCISHSSRHIAVGSDQGYVSVFDVEGPTIIYQKHIASEICVGIISLQFETCSLHGFQKNVLVVATRDSSVLALDSDTGNMLSTSMVHPKKPSRALFMKVLDGHDAVAIGSNLSNGVEDSKQSFLLLCCEKAAYVYSLNHVVQGVKKVQYKKKFHYSSCWASTFCSASEVGLILLFTSGKLEIRSLPELSLLRETSIRGFTYTTPKSNSLCRGVICSSWEGELLMVNDDQEIVFVSVLHQRESFRLLDFFSQVYRKDLMVSQEGLVSGPPVHREKKKGIFSSVIKDMKGSKAEHVPDLEAGYTKESIKELSSIFSTANFPSKNEKTENLVMDEAEAELSVDDIDLEDLGEKPKEQNVLAGLNKQKLASTFQAFKGKLKQKKVKNDKNVAKEDQQEVKASAVDQIKKKYGFSLSGESSVAKMAESKLHENLKKLQGISLRTTEMQDTAKSFSAMAKQVLRSAEQDNRSS
ncbi:Lgl_C domain-containing protein [Cephalotus follicularis]|uniref:Lgl_C domain-containing protein n=1 Tax=Cephalotus follicularis TaxID=3775 RepID=A0A1Q3CS08_CEPFO|nr:Lgl_C domain-containing protein [Cephalotus follicularis]